MYYHPLKNNALKNKPDLQKAFLDSLKPYLPHFSPGKALVDLGPPGAIFSQRAAQLEGFARLLWGLIPFLAGGGEFKGWDFFLQGLCHGTDPSHEEYWGEAGDFDQRLVEMAVFGFGLLVIPEKIWEPLDPKSRENLVTWLAQINKSDLPGCNWYYFRVLVNSAFAKLSLPEYNQEKHLRAIDLLQSYYLDKGWYNDGDPATRRARDYYIPWGFQFYNLLLAKYCPVIKEDSSLTDLFKQRALDFSQGFKHWFSHQGPALPFGRSLTYRFAQSAFWGALGLHENLSVDWGEVKGLYLRNLRWWFSQCYYSETGLQSIGYTYPNLIMAERYNSTLSPLWSFKAFIPLAFKEDHPFWTAEEKDLADRDQPLIQPESSFIFSPAHKNSHHFALSSGQGIPGENNDHNHMAEKYNKMGYSSDFGFNLVTDQHASEKAGADNMLLISTGDGIYHFRRESFDHGHNKGCIWSTWYPCEGIKITTFLTIVDQWALRLHYIVAKKDFKTLEGGFPLALEDAFKHWPMDIYQEQENQCQLSTSLGISGIKNIGPPRNGRGIMANPNSNIMYCRSLIPILEASHIAGTHWLGCAALAHKDNKSGQEIWKAFDKQKIEKEWKKSLNLTHYKSFLTYLESN